jgi:putative tryptophan/tyrosine transport system substrate-binding protein
VRNSRIQLSDKISRFRPRLGAPARYRHPGGNLTGVFSQDLAPAGKRVEILKETLPRLSRIATFWDPAFGRQEMEETQRAASLLGVKNESVEVRNAGDIPALMRAAKQKGADALIVTWSPLLWVERKAMPGMALAQGLPIASSFTAADGALLSYGTDLRHNWERACYFIDRLLKGARAAELPVEQASRVNLIVNLKTAQALKIKIPESILLRADEVIR